MTGYCAANICRWEVKMSKTEKVLNQRDRYIRKNKEYKTVFQWKAGKKM